MKSTVFAACAALVVVVATAPTAEAQFAGIDFTRIRKVNASRLNVRTGPSARYSVVGQLTRNQAVYVHRFQSGWAQITYKGARRWTSASFLVSATSTPAPRPTTPAPRPTTTPAPAGSTVSPASYEVSYSRLNVRSGPGTGYRVVTTFNRGTRVTVTRRSGSWNGFSRGGSIVWAYGPGLRRVTAAPPAPAPTPSTRPIVTGTAVGSPYRLKVKIANASLRTRPEASATRIRGLVKNQVLTVVRISGSYRGVKTSSAGAFAGWVHSSLLTGLSSPQTTPPAPTPPAPVRTTTRSGTGTRSVGNSSLGAQITRSCTISHNRNTGNASESWTLTGRLLGNRPRIASGTFRVRAQAGGRPESTSRRFNLLGREFTIGNSGLSRERLWIDDKTLWRGSVGPVPLALKVDAGVKAELSLIGSTNSAGIQGSGALFGEGKVEVDALVVRGGVRATLNIVELSLPATITLSRGSVRAAVDFVVSSNVQCGVYVIVGRKVFGVGWEKEYSFDIPFLQYTFAERRIPVLSLTVSGS